MKGKRMADNKKMQQAKAVKNDEFYTEYGTISDEMGHYRKQFEGQVVYCNCDDPAWSNFWKYFHSNFGSLNLKKLIATHYRKDTEPSYAMIYEGGDDFNMSAGEVVPIKGNDGYNAGDFRSDACVGFLKEATVVSTNPPFSLFREYVAQLIEYGKKFIILGNQNAATYQDIFPLIKENMIWYGASIHSGGIDFRIPDDYEEYSSNVFVKDGKHYINLSGIRWFTNMDVKYRHDGLWHRNGKFDNTQAHCYYEGNEDKYPKFANYDAINVNATKDIPIDYKGWMGVPITWLDKYNPDEFEIQTMTKTPIGNEYRMLIFDKQIQHNPNGTTQSVTKANDGAVVEITKPLHDKPYYSVQGKIYKAIYPRILIRNLHPVKKSEDIGY